MATNSHTSARMISGADFVGMTPQRQHAHFEECGFLVIPGAVAGADVAKIIADTGGSGPSESFEFANSWPPPSLVELIAHPQVLAVLRLCFGEDLRFYKGVFGKWLSPSAENLARGRQLLHQDYSSDGATGGSSCASWCNVAFYFIDLEPDEGPYWVVPGSHKQHLLDEDEREALFPEAKMVLAKAGDAVLFHCRTVHAGGVKKSRLPRPSAFLSYRPAWAAPLRTVAEWPDDIVSSAAPDLRALLEGQNDGMPIGPHGILAT